MNENSTSSAKDTSCLPRFPLSKVKKIAKCDKDYIITSNAAIVAAAFATELFVQSLTEDGLSMAHLQQGKKNKNKNNASKQARLTVDDLIESVQRKEQYYFLEDVINKKMFSKESVSKAAATKEQQEGQHENNQSTLSFGTSNGKNALQAIETDDLSDDEDAMDVDSDQEHGEGIVEGVEEDDDDEDEDGDIQEDEEDTGLQTELNNLHNVEDIDVDDDDNNEELNEEEGDSAKQRLVGRAETVEEVESAEE